MHTQCLSFTTAQQKSQQAQKDLAKFSLHFITNFLCCLVRIYQHHEATVSQMCLKYHAAHSQLEFSRQRSQQLLSALWAAKKEVLEYSSSMKNCSCLPTYLLKLKSCNKLVELNAFTEKYCWFVDLFEHYQSHQPLQDERQTWKKSNFIKWKCCRFQFFFFFKFKSMCI